MRITFIIVVLTSLLSVLVFAEQPTTTRPQAATGPSRTKADIENEIAKLQERILVLQVQLAELSAGDIGLKIGMAEKDVLALGETTVTAANGADKILTLADGRNVFIVHIRAGKVARFEVDKKNVSIAATVKEKEAAARAMDSVAPKIGMSEAEINAIGWARVHSETATSKVIYLRVNRSGRTGGQEYTVYLNDGKVTRITDEGAGGYAAPVN